MSISTIEAQIEALVGEIVDIKAVYDYPVVQLGRNLPALIIIYDGVNQQHEAVKQTDTTYQFEFTLYFAAEGRSLEGVWNEIKDVAVQILDKFRANPTLNNTCWASIITSGQTVIDQIDEKPKWIGHTFRLEATKTES